MSRRFVLIAVVGLLSALASATGRNAFAQTPPRTGPAAKPKVPAQAASGQRPLGPQAAGAPAARPPAAISVPQIPEWFPLSKDHQKYLDEVLNFWQESSAKIKRYECQFERWEYDGGWVLVEPKTNERSPNTHSVGEIKYESPDKGMLRVDSIRHYTVKREGDQPKWIPIPGEKGEHWICDGKSIFTFDHQDKKLLQNELPKEMRGKAIVEGPLPFMFGAEAAKIKERFWVRIITPKNAIGEYWLEAVPKAREDASNFKSIQVIIDEKDFLPKAMRLFDLNPKAYTVYEFANRKVNSKTLLENLDQLKLFQKAFYEPATPAGYQKEINHANLPPADTRPAAAPPPPPSQAKRPAATPGAR